MKPYDQGFVDGALRVLREQAEALDGALDELEGTDHTDVVGADSVKKMLRGFAESNRKTARKIERLGADYDS